MALHWDTTKIADHKTTCFEGEGEDRRMKRETEAMIFRSMALDCVPRTEAEAREFFIRDQLLHGLRPDMDLLTEGTADNYRYRAFTLEEVRAHIGLSVNVGYKPREEWLAHWIKNTTADLAKKYDTASGIAAKDYEVLRGEKGDFKDCPECGEKNSYQISEAYCPHCGYEEDIDD